jgi:3-methyladenine DNA glycosylase AlkC
MPDNPKLKDTLLTRSAMDRLAAAVAGVYPGFSADRFLALLYDEAWDGRELLDRARHMAWCLQETLPEGYPEALAILRAAAPSVSGFTALVFSEFVGHYGLDHWELSLPALAFFTPLCSSESAIRPFLLQDPGRALATMRQWAEDENEHVRRLASEGCRPRLPWAVSLPMFKRDPTPLLPILEALRDDESAYVRNSVANNLNDISKDHPDLVLDLAEAWQGQSERTDWVIKHACRTLLKAGNVRAMRLFGFGDPSSITVQNLTLSKDTPHIGDDVTVRFELHVATEAACRVRLERIVYYAKARGGLSGKVFQIREGDVEPGTHTIARTHSFADLSTRKHYAGEHQMAIVVNGVEKARISFLLKA